MGAYWSVFYGLSFYMKLISGKGLVNVIIETPRGSRNKYVHNNKKDGFKLKKILPAGMVFPFDFGYIPGTKGEDGDALDILVIMDEPVFPGCMVSCRIIGAIEAEQTSKKGLTIRNDRFIAVADESLLYSDIKDLNDLDMHIVGQIEHFFVSYNMQEGKSFKPLKRLNAEEAIRLMKKGK